MSSYIAEISEKLWAEHSRAQTVRIANWIGHDPEKVGALMSVFFGNDYRLTQRAAWVVSTIGEDHPNLLNPWLDKMVQCLGEKHHDAVRRNVLRHFQEIEVPEKLWGQLADQCFRFIGSPAEPGAIRAFSITVLEHICQKVPELIPEFREMLEMHLDLEAPAFKSRAKKALVALPNLA